MKKIFILDTNVLLHDSNSIFKFQDNEILIPLCVIEELDAFKSRQDENGRNARQVTRHLDSFIKDNKCLSTGVKLNNGGSLKIITDINDFPIPEQLSENKTDNKILKLALDLNKKNENIIIITKDINLRVKANSLSLKCEDYENGKILLDDLYTGHLELYTDNETINELYQKGFTSIESLKIYNDEFQLYPNQYLTLIKYDKSSSVLAKYDGQKILPVEKIPKNGIWGIFNKNREQLIALDLLLNTDIELVTLIGKAGTGKTLLALAAGLHGIEEKNYNRVLVSRPVFPMGKDLGYLPGTKEEKMDPWMQPIYDNADFLLNCVDRDGKNIKGHKTLIDMGFLEIEALTYIRGRSIPNQFMIVDEAQNLTPHEIKTIITRAGQGTKIILTGDPQQIDNPYVDSSSNGLSYAVEKFKNESIAGHITLIKGERSRLAELASNIL